VLKLSGARYPRTELPDGWCVRGVERVLVASSGLGRLVLELPAARSSGWLSNEASARLPPRGFVPSRGQGRCLGRAARGREGFEAVQGDLRTIDLRDLLATVHSYDRLAAAKESLREVRIR
jgi:hypothetical protein